MAACTSRTRSIGLTPVCSTERREDLGLESDCQVGVGLPDRYLGGVVEDGRCGSDAHPGRRGESLAADPPRGSRDGAGHGRPARRRIAHRVETGDRRCHPVIHSYRARARQGTQERPPTPDPARRPPPSWRGAAPRKPRPSGGPTAQARRRRDRLSRCAWWCAGAASSRRCGSPWDRCRPSSPGTTRRRPLDRRRARTPASTWRESRPWRCRARPRLQGAALCCACSRAA